MIEPVALLGLGHMGLRIARGLFIAGNEPHLTSTLKLVGDFLVISDIETWFESFLPSDKSGLVDEVVLEFIQALVPETLSQGYADRTSNQKFPPARLMIQRY